MGAALVAAVMTIGRFIPTWAYIATVSLAAGIVMAMIMGLRRTNAQF